MHSKQQNERTEEELIRTIPQLYYTESTYYGTSNCLIASEATCKVICYDIVDQEIAELVNDLNFTQCYYTEITLSLVNVAFTYGNITNGWLKNLSRNIVSLEIMSDSLRIMGESAFSGKPFKNLQKLVVDGSKIKTLRRDTFQYSRLQNLKMISKQSHGMLVESGVLDHLANYLVTLQFFQIVQDCQVIKNITGPDSATFNKLKIIDLRNNMLSTMYNDTFVKAPALDSLFLGESYIKYIEVNAFATISKSLKTLCLSSNQLTNLPEGVFNGFAGEGLININNNPWICDCSLVWLKQFYIENLVNYFEDGDIPFTCTEGDYSSVSFCSSTSSLPSSRTPFTSPKISPTTSSDKTTEVTRGVTETILTTVSTSLFTEPYSAATNLTTVSASLLPTRITTSATTLKPLRTTSFLTTSTSEREIHTIPVKTTIDPSTLQPSPSSRSSGDFEIDCMNSASSRDLRSFSRIFSHSVRVRNNNVTFNFYTIDGTSFFELRVQNSLISDNLFWIDTNNTSNFGCISNIQNSVQLDSWYYANTYVTCLLQDSSKAANPFDCTAVHVPEVWDRRAWILNENKKLVVGSTVLVLTAVALLSSFLIFYLIKRNPKWIEKSETKYKSPANLVMSHFDKQIYTVSPSSTHNDGYVTPITNNKKARRLSTISEKDYEGSFRSKSSCQGGVYESLPLPPNPRLEISDSLQCD